MLTVSVWPIRWARDMACRSFWGFQSESKMMTVSAVARLMPKPPARVLSRNAKSVDPGALKCSMACIAVHSTRQCQVLRIKAGRLAMRGI